MYEIESLLNYVTNICFPNRTIYLKIDELILKIKTIQSIPINTEDQIILVNAYKFQVQLLLIQMIYQINEIRKNGDDLLINQINEIQKNVDALFFTLNPKHTSEQISSNSPPTPPNISSFTTSNPFHGASSTSSNGSLFGSKTSDTTNNSTNNSSGPPCGLFAGPLRSTYTGQVGLFGGSTNPLPAPSLKKYFLSTQDASNQNLLKENKQQHR
jgi:hypothetical protein